jgi:hypothetical protein
MYIALFISSLFFIYLLFITINRFCHIYKIIKSDELDIKNSPVDKLASMFVRALVCFKGACETGAPAATVLGLMMGADEILKQADRKPVFIPAIASMLKSGMSETRTSSSIIKNDLLPKLENNTLERKDIETLQEELQKRGIKSGLTSS